MNNSRILEMVRDFSITVDSKNVRSRMKIGPVSAESLREFEKID